METVKKAVIALGTFDGVHLGHQHIITQLLQIAHHEGLTPIVVTFFPHPSHILHPEHPLKLINSIEERVEHLKKSGVEIVYVQEFTKSFADTTAQDFVKNVLVQELHLKHLLVGYDHSFGKNKEGNVTLLTQIGKQYGFQVSQVRPFYIDNQIISSSVIRQLIAAGNFDKVNQYLGYPFCLFGKVMQGNQLGRKIGYRTANIVLDYSNKIIPNRGVYVVKCTIEKTLYYGMMNIGFRPTVDGKTQTIEVHFFELNQDLYYQKLKVKVLHRLRDELKFDHIEALKNQLDHDKIEAKKWISIFED